MGVCFLLIIKDVTLFSYLSVCTVVYIVLI